MSLLKGMFGGHSDSTLVKMRNIIRDTPGDGFPIHELIHAFADNLDRNYTFDDETVHNLLFSQYGSDTAGLVLMLLYPDAVIQHGKALAEDHMQPKTIFEDPEKREKYNLPDDQDQFSYGYYTDKRFYNSVLNLQLLGAIENQSKSDKLLSEWADEKGKYDLYCDDEKSHEAGL